MTKAKEWKILMVLLAIAVILTWMQPAEANAAPVAVFEYHENIAETISEEVIETEMSDNMFEEFQDRCILNYAVAMNKSEECQIAVAATIINREEDSGFANNLYNLIETFEEFAKSGNWEDNICEIEDIPNQNIGLVRGALNGEDPTEQLLKEEAIRQGLDPVEYAEGGALFFYNPESCNQQELEARSNIKVKVDIDGYIFYKVWDV